MHDGFDREFYRRRWQQVLPLGPLGIQPYVRTGRGSGWVWAGSLLQRLGAALAAMVPGAIALWRRGVNGVAAPERRRWRSARPSLVSLAPSQTAGRRAFPCPCGH